MAQSIVLKHQGLYTYPNPLSSRPEGALQLATNIIIDRDNTAEPRRGYSELEYPLGTDSNNRPDQIMTFGDNLVAHYGLPQNPEKLAFFQKESTFTGTISSGSNSITDITSTVDFYSNSIVKVVEKQTIFSANQTLGSNILTNVVSTQGLYPGLEIGGRGIPPGTTITSIAGTVLTFSPTDVDISTDKLTIVNHGLSSGQLVTFSSTGTLPGGLSASDIYYAIPSSNDVISLTDLSGSPIDLTSQGTGTHSIIESDPFEITISNNALFTAVGNTITATNKNLVILPSDTRAVVINSSDIVMSNSNAYTSRTVSFPSSQVDTTNNKIIILSHGLVNGDAIQFSTTGTLPSPLSSTAVYYVVESDSNAIKLSNSLNGSAISLIDQGIGTHTITVRDSFTIGGWIDYPGSFINPTGNVKMRYAEQDNSLFFTSEEGIRKLDNIAGISFFATVTDGSDIITNCEVLDVYLGEFISGPGIPDGSYVIDLISDNSFQISQNVSLPGGLASASDQLIRVQPRLAGIPYALDGEASLISGLPGFLPDDRSVQYFILWGYKDANDRIARGAPSSRSSIIVSNSSGSNQNAQISFTVPDGITPAHFYQIYRSGFSATAADVPPSDSRLIYEANPSYTEILNKIVTFVDDIPEELRTGEILYTSEGQEGVESANFPPLFAKDISSFKNSLFLSNTRDKHNLSLTILSVSGSFDIQGDTAIGSNTISNIVDMTGIQIGQIITGTGIPASTFVETVTIATNSITITNNATANGTGISLTLQNGTSGIEVGDTITIAGLTYTAAQTEDYSGTNRDFKVYAQGSPAQNIANTALSLIRVINRQTGAVGSPDVYAQYTSQINNLPGEILIEARTYTGELFYATADSTSTGAAFIPALPGPGGVTVFSKNEENKNNLAYSKYGLPEAFVLGNQQPIGNSRSETIRIIPLRDSLFVLKEDGAFRVTGEDPESFRSSIFDNTIALAAPESVAKLDNTIFALSREGIVTITDSRSDNISRPIENLVLDTFEESEEKVRTLTFGFNYDSDKKYILFTIKSRFDTSATQAFVYNAITNTWTTWELNRTCGVVLEDESLIYLGRADRNTFKVERKDRNYKDYIDDDFDVSIEFVTGVLTSGSNQVALMLPDTTHLAVGMTVQGTGIPSGTKIQSIDDNFTITLNKAATVTGLVELSFQDNTLLRLANTFNTRVGDVIYQNDGRFSIITSVDSDKNTIITKNPIDSWTEGDAKILVGINTVLQYGAQTCGNPSITKQVSEFVAMFEEPFFDTATVGFYTDLSKDEESVDITGQIGGVLWGLYSWGSGTWGGIVRPSPIRTYVPREKQRNTQINIKLTHREAFAYYRLSGIELFYNRTSQRVRR